MSTIIYSITLQVLRLPVTCLIMFFVRQHRVKVIAVFLLLNVYSTYGEPPISSNYLPPNQVNKSTTFFDSRPNAYNSNLPPIETSISLTTNEPSFTTFNDLGTSLNNYSWSDRNQNSNKAPDSNGSGNDNFSRQTLEQSQQLGGINKGYFYEQPKPTFKEPNTFVGSLLPSNFQNVYQSGSLNSNNYSPATVSSTLYEIPSTISANFSQNSFQESKDFLKSSNNGPPKSIGLSNDNFPFTGSRFPSIPNFLNTGAPTLSIDKNQFAYTSQNLENKIPSTSNVFKTSETLSKFYGPPSTNFPSETSFSNIFSSPSSSYEPSRDISSPVNSQSYKFEETPGKTVHPSNFPMEGYQNPSNQGQHSLLVSAGYNSELSHKVRPPFTYNGALPAAMQNLKNQNHHFSTSYNPSVSTSSVTRYSENTQNPALLSSSNKGSFSSSEYNQNLSNLSPPSQSYGTSSTLEYDQGRPSSSSSSLHNAQSSTLFKSNESNLNPARPFSPVPTASLSTPQGYDQNMVSQARPSPNYGQNSQKLPQFVNQLYVGEAPISLYGTPFSNFGPQLSNSFQNKQTSSHQLTSNTFQPPLQSSNYENTPPQSYIPPPNVISNNKDGLVQSPKLNDRTPSVNSPIQRPIFPSYYSTNFFGKNYTPTKTEENSTATTSGISAEASLQNANTYEKESIRNVLYDQPYNPSLGSNTNTAFNSVATFSNGNQLSSIYNTPDNLGNQQNFPSDITNNENLSKFYSTSSKSVNDFSGGENSFPSAQLVSTASKFNGGQPKENTFINPTSSYLPPSYTEGTGYPKSFSADGQSDDIIPSTSYTLPGDESNFSKDKPTNEPKNPNRNIGSDLITGASSSPFRLFDNSPAYSSHTPYRTTYEKSHEITNNELPSTGSDSSGSAKYEFNYKVKNAATEFSHQESRNGSTTSGSYGVILPDGRKQVVDYEANQEGFYPKIRYEENTSKSAQEEVFNQQSLNKGYNYSNQPQLFNESFRKPSNPNYYQELQPPYPSSEFNDQYSRTNQDFTPTQSSYPNSESNFNTYKNLGTSPSGNQDLYSSTNQLTGSLFASPQNSQNDISREGYKYTPTSNLYT